MRKRVGITYRNPNKVKPYEEALRSVGIEPVLISPKEPHSVDGLDGLLLSGGTDLNPSMYHQQPHPASDEPYGPRDRLEKQLLLSALDRDLPVLAICRGMQLFNVALGGTLEQHVEGHRQPGIAQAHPIAVDPSTRLAEAI